MRGVLLFAITPKKFQIYVVEVITYHHEKMFDRKRSFFGGWPVAFLGGGFGHREWLNPDTPYINPVNNSKPYTPYKPNIHPLQALATLIATRLMTRCAAFASRKARMAKLSRLLEASNRCGSGIKV